VQGQGDAGTVLQLFYEWPWNTQEVLDLLNWMRAYNADPTHLLRGL
jgi:erythromycin esterase-like protein